MIITADTITKSNLLYHLHLNNEKEVWGFIEKTSSACQAKIHTNKECFKDQMKLGPQFSPFTGQALRRIRRCSITAMRSSEDLF